jgi:hypothetical protein
MTDESILPGWKCALEHPDAQLAHVMLDNHGVVSQVVPSGLILNHRHPSVWVHDEDFSRAEALVREMLDALDKPAQGPAWTCASCGEENEAEFDICWSCGRDQSGELVVAPEREIAGEDGNVAEDGEGEEEAGPADDLTREPDDDPTSSDERVLRELEEAGADLSQPRDIVHFLYVATPADARAVIASLHQHGFECEEREAADSDEAPHPWLILARKHGVADPNSVGQARRLLELLAAMYHGDYDGWEAPVDP